MDALTVAAATWTTRDINHESGFFSHLSDILMKSSSADILLLPENFNLELLTAYPQPIPDQPRFLSQFSTPILDHLQQHVNATGQTLIAGTLFIRSELGDILNVAPILRPFLPPLLQPKIKLTQYERDPWGITPGSGYLRPPAPLGVSTCYDSEFPEGIRLLCEAGVTLLAIPAFTEGDHGFYRVRWSAKARAIENQIFVLHSSLNGHSEAANLNHATGTSAIIAPSLAEFGPHPILAESNPSEPDSIALAPIRLSDLERIRTQGDVRNWNDRDPSPWRFLD